MLLTPSLLLNRARRQGKAVPYCVVRHLDIAQAAVAAAEKANRSLILAIPVEHVLHLEVATFCAFLLQIAHTSKIGIAVVAQSPVNKEIVEKLVDYGFSGLAFPDKGEMSRKHLHEITKWASHLTGKNQVELIGTVDGLITPARLTEFLESTNLQALFVPLGVQTAETSTLSLPYIQQLAKVSKLPLIAQAFPLRGSEFAKCFAAGTTAFSIEQVLEEGYVAGLRTGLRNRSVILPEQYMSYARKAVEQQVHQFFQYV